MRQIIFWSALLLFFASCCSRGKQTSNKFSDATLVKLFEFQDRRQSDSLLTFLHNSNAEYRQAALMALASVQDTSCIKYIRDGLGDKNAAVRRSAAFALGQTKESSAEKWLLDRIGIEKDSLVRRELFEALGKVTSHQIVKSWNSSNDIDIPWLYYRYGLRENCDTTIVRHAARFLSENYPLTSRIGAAHFFARAKMDPTVLAEQLLIKSSLSDASSEVRMASAAGLKNSPTVSTAGAIEKILNNDNDYRVRVNAVRSLSSFGFADVKDHLLLALNDSNVNVGIAAAETIRSTLTAPFGKEIFEVAKKSSNWRIQAVLFEAAMIFLKGDETKEIFRTVMDAYSTSTNNYQKAALLQAMAHTHRSFEAIRNALLLSDVPVIQSSAAAALVSLNRESDLPSSLQESILQTYVAAIKRGDPAAIGLITDALTDSTLGFKSSISNIDFLRKAKERLSLPRDYESYEPLERAIAFFEGRQPTLIEKKFNHPIDWTLVRSIPRDQQAIINTTKGDITIRLFVEEAPGTVGNFVDLINRNYYNGKVFHRVVPNFVIQGGCPRGDGWGSEDYSIRSEFSGRRYKGGSMGMASAGKDTEGVQWFITHSPTPHLDGRYTIFAEVTDGMDVVHKIEVGDSIIDIRLINAQPQ
ncbi:MAG TPA: peptidylprolyl isomerase [Cyclobacteriaceae bacterium]|nr:peptidylprolyl isomerase [Cyclobacteriaceae bacterium]